MNDLLQATGYAAIVYVLFNSLVTFGSGRPLVEWINPGRKYLPLLALALIGGAYSSLRYAANRYHKSQWALLFDLVGEEKAKPEVVGAVSFLTFGVAVLMVAGWCWWYLPRGPQTFSPNPKDLAAEFGRALRHYVRWAGGLDFAMLCEIQDGKVHVVAEAADDKAIRRGLDRLPGAPAGAPAGDGAPPAPDIDGQKQVYRALAADLVGRWKTLNEAVLPARQGANVGVSFDMRYGAVYAEMIAEAAGPDFARPVGVFLFAVSLNQHEVSTLTAARHFAMLSQAVRHIRTGVAKG